MKMLLLLATAEVENNVHLVAIGACIPVFRREETRFLAEDPDDGQSAYLLMYQERVGPASCAGLAEETWTALDAFAQGRLEVSDDLQFERSALLA